MSRRARMSIGCVGLAMAFLSVSQVAQALEPDVALQRAQAQVAQGASGVARVKSAVAKSKVQARTGAQRIADGELLLRNRDYDRAIVVFSQVVEQHANEPSAYAEALFLLGEAYYGSKQNRSAWRTYSRVLDESLPRLAPFRSRALARLADIALRTKDVSALEGLRSRLRAMPPSAESTLSYARGRISLAGGDLATAQSSFAAVGSQSPFYHQAQYMVGVVEVRRASAATVAAGAEKSDRGTYAKAIEAFHAVTKLRGDTRERQHVVDLAWLAIGRLSFETEQFEAAVSAYSHIDRASSEFERALFELSSVYMKMGDMRRAQRSLELLSVLNPTGQDAAEAALLRGELELRAGQLEKARKTFESIRAQYDPPRESVDAFLKSTQDPAVYYDRLIDDQLDAINADVLPPLAVDWARSLGNGPEAFAVVDEVVKTKRLLEETQDLAGRLSAIMNSPGGIRAFPQLRASKEAGLSALNTVMRARVTLAQGLDSLLPTELNGELATLTPQRRALEAQILALPVTEADFQKRDVQATAQWNKVSHRAMQLQLQVDALQAGVNALRRVLREGSSNGVVRDEQTMRRFQADLTENERDIAIYKQELAKLRKLINHGRAATGGHDPNVFQDDSLRAQYNQLLSREFQLVGQGAAGVEAGAYAGRATPLLVQSDQIDVQLQREIGSIAEQVRAKTDELETMIRTEKSNLDVYEAKLDLLDQEARLVVGEVALKNFGLVRDRLRTIVLRSDVGSTEEAWETREDRMARVRSLQRQKADAERLLNEELREVLDDAVDQ